jgi:2-dehydro-3-deoxyphosphogluconate aldolase/(4S)-4-hydroxy-2-oxoglutarate aldolase
MSVREHRLHRILKPGVVIILRLETDAGLEGIADAAMAAGVEALEITFTMPRPVRCIERLVEHCGARMMIGAGTVLDAATARIALLAGAQFIVSPITDVAMIEMCRRYDVLALPGALTPTEIMQAWQAGADIVKIFPSDFTGPDYFAAVRRPLPQVRLMPTGGVTLDNVHAFIQAGASAVGLMGGQFLDASPFQFDRCQERIAEFVARVAAGRR